MRAQSKFFVQYTQYSQLFTELLDARTRAYSADSR